MAGHRVDWHQPFPQPCRGGVVTIGNFDGAHRGHATLIQELHRLADSRPTVVLTFDPHPLQVLRPEFAVPLLTLPDDRARLLHDLGADHVITLATTPDLLELTAEAFFHQVIRNRLDARALVEGQNFGFGRGREGSVAILAGLCGAAGIGLTVVPPLMLDGIEVSSSRIRAALLEGRLTEANAMLGRPYRLGGLVVEGARRGRTIGFPTANLEGVGVVVPAEGVYAARAFFGQEAHLAAVNIGPNPTFGETGRKIEAHLLDFSGNLYGRILHLDLLARLRPTKAFRGVQELTEQLNRDLDHIRRMES